MTVYLVISLTKSPYLHHIFDYGQPYTYNVQAFGPTCSCTLPRPSRTIIHMEHRNQTCSVGCCWRLCLSSFRSCGATSLCSSVIQPSSELGRNGASFPARMNARKRFRSHLFSELAGLEAGMSSSWLTCCVQRFQVSVCVCVRVCVCVCVCVCV